MVTKLSEAMLEKAIAGTSQGFPLACSSNNPFWDWCNQGRFYQLWVRTSGIDAVGNACHIACTEFMVV